MTFGIRFCNSVFVFVLFYLLVCLFVLFFFLWKTKVTSHIVFSVAEG